LGITIIFMVNLLNGRNEIARRFLPSGMLSQKIPSRCDSSVHLKYTKLLLSAIVNSQLKTDHSWWTSSIGSRKTHKQCAPFRISSGPLDRSRCFVSFRFVSLSVPEDSSSFCCSTPIVCLTRMLRSSFAGDHPNQDSASPPFRSHGYAKHPIGKRVQTEELEVWS
jgi:hypothetical protein